MNCAQSLTPTNYRMIGAIQQWVLNPELSSCGNVNGSDDSRYYKKKERNTTTSDVFDFRGFEESKHSDDTPFLSGIRCSGRELSSAMQGDLNCNGGSDDYSTSDDGDQMRRLASWGTYGTLATHDSLDLMSDSRIVDDDGNPINPQILEKAKQNREKMQLQQMKKPRAVQFAYPPISSLKQCPRLDPEEVDICFFSDKELETYENDRQTTGNVDDVEIVAVSTSFSDDIPTAPKPDTQHLTQPTPKDSTKHRFTNILMSPSYRKACTDNQRQNGNISAQSGNHVKQINLWGRQKGRLVADENILKQSQDQSEELMEQKKEKRLLKSVQIFLRARSTTYS